MYGTWCRGRAKKPDTPYSSKAATPLKDNNYIYFIKRFETFWDLYPEKKSKEAAKLTFAELNPNELLFENLINALQKQIDARNTKLQQGEWVPPWKYPANWLGQKCWEDEITKPELKERKNAKHRSSTQAKSSEDMFWGNFEDEQNPSNVIELCQFQKGS